MINLTDLDSFFTILSIFLLFVLATKVAFFLVLSSLQHYRKKRISEKEVEGRRPFVSVIVPCWNEELTLENCVNSLVKQKYEEMEIIIVDDGSTDNTFQIAKELERSYREKVRLISKENGGKAKALNCGIEHAKGELVICIDADSVFLEDTVYELVKPFSGSPDLVAVGGNVKVGNRKKYLNKHQALEYIFGLGLQRRSFACLSCMQVISGAIGAFRKDKLLEIGGYSTDTLVEDMDLTVSLQKAGGRIDYSSNAISYTEAPENIKDFVKQRYRWTYGGFQVLRKHKDIIFNPKYGFLGLIGLPYFLIFTWVDVVVSLLFIGALMRTILMADLISSLPFYLGMSIIQSLLIFRALIWDDENLRLVFLAPIESLWYNHLISFVTLKAGINYLRGQQTSWNRVTRFGRNCHVDDSYFRRSFINIDRYPKLPGNLLLGALSVLKIKAVQTFRVCRTYIF